MSNWKKENRPGFRAWMEKKGITWDEAIVYAERDLKESDARIRDLTAQLAAATARAETAEKENTRLIGGDIKRLCIEAGHLEADIQGGIGVKIFAHMVGEYFRTCGATNFAAVDVIDNSKPDDPLMLQVVVQRKHGESPADKIGQLTAERDAATARADTLDAAGVVMGKEVFAAARTSDCHIGSDLLDWLEIETVENPIARGWVELAQKEASDG